MLGRQGASFAMQSHKGLAVKVQPVWLEVCIGHRSVLAHTASRAMHRRGSWSLAVLQLLLETRKGSSQDITLWKCADLGAPWGYLCNPTEEGGRFGAGDGDRRDQCKEKEQGKKRCDSSFLTRTHCLQAWAVYMLHRD